MNDKSKQIDIDVIKQILEKKEMTIQDLAKKMGKERSVVYKTIINGNPTLGFMLSLSRILNMPIEALVSATPEAENTEAKEQIDGFIEINGKVFRIRSKQDFESVFNSL